MAMTQPGWYPDPAGSGGQRWWDGHQSGATAPTVAAPAVEASGRGMATAAICCGIGGVVLALIPILGIFGLGLGLVALVLGFVSWRSGKRAGRRQGRAGMVLGACAVMLGVVGLVIVSNAFNKLDSDLDCLANAQTSAEIDACGD